MLNFNFAVKHPIMNRMSLKQNYPLLRKKKKKKTNRGRGEKEAGRNRSGEADLGRKWKVRELVTG